MTFREYITYFREGDGPLVFGYGRTSTNKQEISIDVQEAAVRERAASLPDPWGHFFADEGVSGTRKGIPFADRFEARQLMEIVRRGDHLVVTKLDRFGRTLKDIVSVLDYFTRQEVNIYILQHGTMQLNLTTSVGRLIVGVLAVFADFEGNLIAERIREALQFRKAHGLPYNRWAEYGKRHVRIGPKGQGGRTIAEDCPREIALLRRAYFMQATLGMSIRDITKGLNDAREYTGNGFRWSKSRLHRGIVWYREQVAAGKIDELV